MKLQNILFVWYFFVLVKYLQLWSTVQCLRIKFTAFRDSRDKKKIIIKKNKNRKSTPKSQSAINTCCMFLIAASIHITRFITSRNTNRFIRTLKKNQMRKKQKKCTWTSENKQSYNTTYMMKKQNYLRLTAFVFLWMIVILVVKTYIPSSRCCYV